MQLVLKQLRTKILKPNPLFKTETPISMCGPPAMIEGYLTVTLHTYYLTQSAPQSQQIGIILTTFQLGMLKRPQFNLSSIANQTQSQDLRLDLSSKARLRSRKMD